MCNNCIHKPVCSKFAATGGHVRECEHYREDRKGRWIYRGEADADQNVHANCSFCGAGETHAVSMIGKVPYCWECGADMRSMEGEDVQA